MNQVPTFPLDYTHEWIQSMFHPDRPPAAPDDMSVEVLTLPRSMRFGVEDGRPVDVLIVAAIELPGGWLTSLAVDADGQHIALPAVNRAGELTAWEPVGWSNPVEGETGADKMHRLGRWLADIWLNRPPDPRA